MVKIIFEVSEDFIEEKATVDAAVATAGDGGGDGKSVIKALFGIFAYGLLKKRVEEGETEFVVTPDRLSEKALEVYNNEITEICCLGAISEKEEGKSEGATGDKIAGQ